MKGFNSEETLWMALPILIVVLILVAGIVFLPQIQNTDIRGRASEPAPAVVTPTITSPQPEIVCSTLYAPVCAQGRTFSNDCEANLAGYIDYTEGECIPLTLPQSN